MFKVQDIVPNLNMMCNYKLSIFAAKFMTYGKELRVTITFF